MPYITNRLKERLFDELQDVLKRLRKVQEREKDVRRELSAILTDRRELERLVNKVQKEVLTGEVEDDEEELPIMAAERAAANGDGLEARIDAYAETKAGEVMAFISRTIDGSPDAVEADVQAAMGRSGADLVTSRAGSSPSSNGHPDLEANAWKREDDDRKGGKAKRKETADART